jgi:hypothetical protein
MDRVLLTVSHFCAVMQCGLQHRKAARERKISFVAPLPLPVGWGAEIN